MAEFGIVVGIDKIKGNCKLADYKDYILAESLSFGSAAARISANFGAKDSVSVTQSSVTTTLAAGKWTPELFQACYNLTRIGDVKIIQLAQSVDKAAEASPSVLQKLTLSNAIITAADQNWGSGQRLVSVTLEFDKILLEINGKPADFVLRNFT